MEVYFAYGSNINMKQMKLRCPSVQFRSKAVLQGYRFAFPLRSKRWGGGVAGILIEKGEEVEGVVYELSEEDLERLDKFEGVDKERYYRKKVKVVLGDGSSIEAWTFFPNSDKKSSFLPSKKYLETILEGAREHQLSKHFIENLKSIKSKKGN